MNLILANFMAEMSPYKYHLFFDLDMSLFEPRYWLLPIIDMSKYFYRTTLENIKDKVPSRCIPVSVALLTRDTSSV